EGVTWMPAREAFGFELPAPMNKNDRILGVIRGGVESPDAAIAIFRKTLAAEVPGARRRGEVSHALFVRLPAPGEAARPEVIGLDHWCDGQGMSQHYKEIAGVYEAFSGRPQTSVWEAARGGIWSEW